jgi:TolA-binding protein
MAQQAFDDGWASLRVGDFARAATAFERALAVTGDPRVIEDAAFWRGVALARGGEVIKAAHVFTAFLTAYPRSARSGEAHVALGWLLFERRELAGASAEFEAALADTSARVRDRAAAGLAAIARARPKDVDRVR